MVSVSEPSYEQIKDLALKLYLGKNPWRSTASSDEELKLEGYWTQARLILQGKKKVPKYVQKAFYSAYAHLERLKELLEWAKSSKEVKKCLKRKAFKKAEHLIRQEGLERYRVSSTYAAKYTKIVLTRLRKGSEIQTEWGTL